MKTNVNAELTPATVAEPIDISIKGYVEGMRFYLGLVHKRVKGKFKVRGERKQHFSAAIERYSPLEWQEHKREEREKQNKEVA